MLRFGLPCLLAVLPSGSLAGQGHAEAERLLAGGDTSGAIAAYEELLRHNRRDAEAHYRAGMLYLSRHPPGAAVSPNRRKAEEHIRYATRFEDDSAKYWIALADLLRGENLVTTRLQVGGLVDRARAAAERSGATADLARAAYRQARINWERYEHYANRYRHQEAGAPVVLPTYGAEWKDVEQFYTERLRAVPTDAHLSLVEAEDHLWRALEAAPADVDVAGLLVITMGEQRRWAESVELTRRLLRVAPESGRAWALRGLALARAGRWSEAQASFDTAFRVMSDEERAPFRNLGQIMRAADRIRFGQMGTEEQARLDSLYWFVAQPLALTPTNEVQSEFYARLVYVEHRWTDPWRGYRGHETDMGAVYVRYGPPDIWATVDRSSISWLYLKPRFFFSFSLMPGFARAYFAGDSREAARVAGEQSPARFDNIPLYRTLDTILVQTAQFRGPEDSTAVAVFGALPLGRLVDSTIPVPVAVASGALITDDLGHELTRDRREETVTPGGREVAHRSWRLMLRPGSYFLRVEAHAPALDRGARSVETVAVRGYSRTRLSLSDVLVAQRVAPRDSVPARWTDFLIEPSGGRFTPGDSVGLLWEIYNLTADSLGITRYTIELRITVEAIDRSRRSLFAEVVGGIADAMGLTAEGDDRITLRYEREEATTAARARAEHLTVDLRGAPEGLYTIGVIVTDRVTGAMAQRERRFTIGQTPVTR